MELLLRRHEYAVVQVAQSRFWVFNVHSKQNHADYPMVTHFRRVREVSLDFGNRTVSCTCGGCEDTMRPCVHVVSVFDTSDVVMWDARHHKNYQTDYAVAGNESLTNLFEMRRQSPQFGLVSFDGVDCGFVKSESFPAYTRQSTPSVYDLMRCLCPTQSLGCVDVVANFAIEACISPEASRIRSNLETPPSSMAPKKLQYIRDQQVATARTTAAYDLETQLVKMFRELRSRKTVVPNKRMYSALVDCLRVIEEECDRHSTATTKVAPSVTSGIAFPTMGLDKRKYAKRHKAFHERR